MSSVVPTSSAVSTAPAVPTPPAGERFPVLWLLIYHISRDVQSFDQLLTRLRSLQECVHAARPQAPEIHRRLGTVHDAYRDLQERKLWGTTDVQQEAIKLLNAEIYTAFPPPARSGPNIAALVAGGALAAMGAVVVLPAVAIGGLGLLGFSAAGPVAGSIAAGIQSAVYGGAVASGSAFALAQAAAMGGIAVGSAAEVIAGAFALSAGVGLLANGSQGAAEDED